MLFVEVLNNIIMIISSLLSPVPTCIRRELLRVPLTKTCKTTIEQHYVTSYFSHGKLQAAVAADAAKSCPAFCSVH